MQKNGELNFADNHTSSMTIQPIKGTHETTYIDDGHITQTTNMPSPHLEGIPHAYIVTTLTFSTATYGPTLLASRQLRWTNNLPEECIYTRFPENLRKPLLVQVPTIARKNVGKPNNAKETCTIHNHDFQGLTTASAFNLFRTSIIHTLHPHLTTVDHKYQSQTATCLVKLWQPTQALLHTLDSVQPSTRWHTYARPNTMMFTPTEVEYNPLRLQV